MTENQDDMTRFGCPSQGDLRTSPARGDFDAGRLDLDAQPRRMMRNHLEVADPAGPVGTRLGTHYYKELHSFISDMVPAGARVLDLGCGDGTLLARLNPSLGVGVDVSDAVVKKASAQHPDLLFVRADVEKLPITGIFDYVIISNVVGYLFDVWSFLRKIRPALGADTRIILTYYNFLWEPALRVAQRLRLKRHEPLQNWLSTADLRNLLELTDLEPVAFGYRTVLPVGPDMLMRPFNRVLGVIPFLRRLGIISYVRARLKPEAPRKPAPTCTVVVPTRNERGNIEPLISRLPQLGSHTELIFVDGNSTDGTADEITRVMADYPERDIKLIHQNEGVGKGDAVRRGFAAATGDVLMILDADLTVPPEDLPKFWDALTEEKGEFINGTRLVYPMEKQAMRLANIAGNKVFSLIFSWILDQRITDTLCGTKVLWAADYRRIEANRELFGDFDPFGDFDLLFGAAQLGLKIREVPVRYRDRTYGTTNIDRWRHGLMLVRMAAVGARRLRFR